MTKLYEFPEQGELVIATVKNVKNFGAFVTLDEYEDKEGFIHIAEVATGWVKYIRDFVREGQKIVCKVLKVDESKVQCMPSSLIILGRNSLTTQVRVPLNSFIVKV